MARRARIVPDSWQSDLLRSDAKQLILNCSRQSGKSTITAVLGLHTALFEPNSLVLLLSPSLRQSQELFRKLKDFYNAVGCDSLPRISEESSLRLEFHNGSRVVRCRARSRRLEAFPMSPY
jgi:phage terminase large subunit-like protein